jgi:hypothetical protein
MFPGCFGFYKPVPLYFLLLLKLSFLDGSTLSADPVQNLDGNCIQRYSDSNFLVVFYMKTRLVSMVAGAPLFLYSLDCISMAYAYLDFILYILIPTASCLLKKKFR